MSDAARNLAEQAEQHAPRSAQLSVAAQVEIALNRFAAADFAVGTAAAAVAADAPVRRQLLGVWSPIAAVHTPEAAAIATAAAAPGRRLCA